MNCQEMRGALDAYIDSELDVINTVQFEQHIAECASCQRVCENYRKLHDSVRAQMPYYALPKGVEERIRASLRSESRDRARSVSIDWRLLAVAATAVLAAVGILLWETVPRSADREMLAEQVVSSHIRSLMANHLDDVVSSDRHTVKPWFNGKIDFAPDVRDLADKGFPLQGGRLDYLDSRPVAALIYKRREHTINVFLWPTNGSDSKASTNNIKGYSVVHWTRSHMRYWAVSDLNAIELNEFANDLGN